MGQSLQQIYEVEVLPLQNKPSYRTFHATTVHIHSLIIVPRLTRNALMSGSWCPNRRTALHARKGWSALQLLSARALRI
jgi:hypothetical protein